MVVPLGVQQQTPSKLRVSQAAQQTRQLSPAALPMLRATSGALQRGKAPRMAARAAQDAMQRHLHWGGAVAPPAASSSTAPSSLPCRRGCATDLSLRGAGDSEFLGARSLKQTAFSSAAGSQFGDHRTVPMRTSAVYVDSGASSAFDSSTGRGAPVAPGGSQPLVFVQYTFYKAKCALEMKPIKPTFRRLDSGSVALEREGSVFLTFANSIGAKLYEWNKKQIFALSVVEIGKLLSMQPGDRAEFYHDPNMGTDDQGRVRKTLQIEPAKDGGFFFNLTFKDESLGGGGTEKYNIFISAAEFAVIRSALNYIVPVCLGWHGFVDPSTITSGMIKDEGPPAKAYGNDEGPPSTRPGW